MAARLLEFATIPPIKKHTASLIFLHGLGDTSRGWSPVFTLLSRNPKLQHIKFILPNAPIQAVTVNMGMSMPSWFDLRSLDEEEMMKEEVQDTEGLLDSAMGVGRLIGNEVDAGVEGNRIVVGGFSQGGAVALLTGLTSERRLGGIVSLSSWLRMSGRIPSMIPDSARNVPIFFGHGLNDTVVPYKFGRRSYELLKAKPFKFTDATEEDVKGLTWKEYSNMGHSSNMEEIEDLGAWIERVLPALPEEADEGISS